MGRGTPDQSTLAQSATKANGHPVGWPFVLVRMPTEGRQGRKKDDPVGAVYIYL